MPSRRAAAISLTVVLAAAAAGSVALPALAAPPTDASTEPPSPPSPDPSTAPDQPVGAGVSRQVPDGYTWLVDDTGSIVVAVPDTWDDTDLAPVTVTMFSDDPVPYLAASPDRQAFLTDFEAPGVRMVALPYVDEEPQVFADLYHLDTDACDDVVDEPYEDPVFTGTEFTGTGCGDHDATWRLIVAAPPERDFTLLVDVQLVSDADRQAVEIVLDTFNLTELAGQSATTTPDPTDAPG